MKKLTLALLLTTASIPAHSAETILCTIRAGFATTGQIVGKVDELGFARIDAYVFPAEEGHPTLSVKPLNEVAPGEWNQAIGDISIAYAPTAQAVNYTVSAMKSGGISMSGAVGMLTTKHGASATASIRFPKTSVWGETTDSMELECYPWTK